jgi:hypothetical protein
MNFRVNKSLICIELDNELRIAETEKPTAIIFDRRTSNNKRRVRIHVLGIDILQNKRCYARYV